MSASRRDGSAILAEGLKSIGSRVLVSTLGANSFFCAIAILYVVVSSLNDIGKTQQVFSIGVCPLLAMLQDILRAHTMPTATPASQFMWFMLPRIWDMFVVPF